MSRHRYAVARVAALSLLAIVAFSFGGAAINASAQATAQTWQLTTGDFTTRRVLLERLDESGAAVVHSDGAQEVVPAGQLVRLESARAPGRAEAAGPFVLHLRGGDRLRGQVKRLTESALVYELLEFGEIEVPLEQLLALSVSDAVDTDRPWRLPPPSADEVLLANGDRLTGYVSAINGDNWTLTSEAGGETPVAATAIRQVRFADPGVPVARAEKGWRARLADGSELALDALAFADGHFRLMYRGREAQLDAGGVAWVEPVDGPVRWVSELPIARQEHTPYFGAAFPAQTDGLGDGAGRGFVVRSRSRISFELPPGFDRFRVRYAMPVAMTHGNADVRILLDDKPVHERKGLTAAAAVEPVEVTLNGATRLTLEVDYGEGLDVQDVVHWIDPALVRA